MATFQQWNYALPEVNFNPAVSANASSYFVRPAKVVKPNSRNSSPRNLGRRKTTTAASVSSRTKSVVDHVRSATQWQNSEMPRSRPLSWHPDYFEASNIDPSPPFDREDSSCWGFATAQVNGLITPVCYPSVSEPQIQELFTPLDELPAQDPSLSYECQQYTQLAWASQTGGKVESYSPPLYAHQVSMQPAWYVNQAMMAANVQTAPSSPDCSPLRNIGLDTLSLGKNQSKSKDNSEELVGMGLYDSPAEVQSSSLLFGGLSGSGRRGLKLEESFEPTEQDDDEQDEQDEEDEEDEADDDDDDEDQHNAMKEEEVDVKWDVSPAVQDDPHSIASHLTYGLQPRPEPLASQYLATLRQMNSAYYPAEDTGHDPSYGWI